MPIEDYKEYLEKFYQQPRDRAIERGAPTTLVILTPVPLVRDKMTSARVREGWFNENAAARAIASMDFAASKSQLLSHQPDPEGVPRVISLNVWDRCVDADRAGPSKGIYSL